jgi:hypothetical protein
MQPEDGMNSQDDIQQALHQAQSMGGDNSNPAADPNIGPSDTLVQQKSCPMLGLRYAVYKSGLMAEKYPWQTVMALLIATGCGWLCSYFGMTVLAALVVYAVYSEE